MTLNEYYHQSRGYWHDPKSLNSKKDKNKLKSDTAKEIVTDQDQMESDCDE